jgi:hypothetical protein
MDHFQGVLNAVKLREMQIMTVAAHYSEEMYKQKYLANFVKKRDFFEFDLDRIGTLTSKPDLKFVIPGNNPGRPTHNSHSYVSLESVYLSGEPPKHCELAYMAKLKKTPIDPPTVEKHPSKRGI